MTRTIFVRPFYGLGRAEQPFIAHCEGITYSGKTLSKRETAFYFTGSFCQDAADYFGFVGGFVLYQYQKPTTSSELDYQETWEIREIKASFIKRKIHKWKSIFQRIREWR